MTEPKFSMVHQADTYEETIIDGFAIYAFLSYSDCEESARQQDCLDDTEEEESVHGDKRTPTTATSKSPSAGGYIRNYGPKQRSRSDSRSSIGDTPNGSIYLENGKNTLFHRSLAKRKAGRPKGGGYRRSRIQIKHEIFTDLRDSSIDAQQLDCLYNDYLQDRFKKEEENKYKFTIPKSMDENFVNLSLNALDSSLNKPLPTTTTTTRVDNINIKKELKNGIENNVDDYHHHHLNVRKETFVKIPETPENDVDLTEMISRHSKREIRLPARYHQSGLLMGSHWVIPELDSEEKIPKKKIKIEEPDESKSSMETTQMRTQALVYHHPKQELPQRQPLTQPQLTQPQQISARSQPSTSPLLPPPPPPPPLQQQLMQKPLSTPPPLLHKQSHFKPLYSCENQRIIYSTSNSSNNNNIDRTTEEDKTLSSGLFNESKGINNNNVDDVSNLNSPIKTSCPSLVSHLKLHQEKIEKLQLLRKQQEAGSGGGKLCENNTVINNPSKDYHQEVSLGDKGLSIISPIISDRSDLLSNKMDSTSPSCGSPELKQNQSKPLVSTYLTPVGLNSSQSSSDSSTTPTDNPDIQDQKSPRQQQLRQLYRDLYFENRPERRLIYAKNRIKPRVNKKSEVEESIKVIEKLNKRNKQLDYIKKLLTMWNKKLTLAAKVINDKEVIPKGIDIVRDVLKTYQASKSYRVTEAWNLLSKSKTEPPPPTSLSTISNQIAIESSPQQPSLVSQPTPTTTTTVCVSSSIGQQQPPQQQHQLPQTPLAVSQPIQPSRQFVKSCSSVIKTTGSLSRIVVNPQAKSNVTPESRVNLKTLSLPVATTTLTTITSSTKTIDHHSSASTEKSSNGVSVLSKISNSPPRIKPMVPLNQSQSSNQPSHVHIYPSLPPPVPPPPPPPLPPPLQASYSLTSLTRPPTQQPLPTILSTPLSNLNLILIVRAKNNQRRIERIELQK